MKRSPRKKENKAKLAASREKVKRSDGVKRGFRKLDVEGAIYSWRYGGGDHVEIRTPGKLSLRWLVPLWKLQNFESKEAWMDAYKDDDGDRGSNAWWVDPSSVRKYIDSTASQPVCNH